MERAQRRIRNAHLDLGLEEAGEDVIADAGRAEGVGVHPLPCQAHLELEVQRADGSHRRARRVPNHVPASAVP